MTRVLLVVDDPEIRTTLAGSLRQTGADVLAVDSAAAALLALSGSGSDAAPDLVLMDPRGPDALFLATALPLADRAVLTYAGIEMQDAARQVLLDGVPLALTPTEYSLLKVFLLNPDRVLSKRELLRAAWGHDAANQLNNVELYVGYLRRKLNRPLLHTVRGFGYRLRDEGSTPRQESRRTIDLDDHEARSLTPQAVSL